MMSTTYFIVTTNRHTAREIAYPEIKETRFIPISGEVFGSRAAAERYCNGLLEALGKRAHN